MPDVQQFQCFVNTVGDFGFCQSLIARAIGHVLGHGIRKKLMFGMLHHITHMTAKLHKLLPRCGFGTCTGACGCCHRHVGYVDTAGSRRGQSAEQSNQSRFARAIRAHQCYGLAARDSERQVVDGRMLGRGISICHMRNPDDGVCGVVV